MPVKYKNRAQLLEENARMQHDLGNLKKEIYRLTEQVKKSELARIDDRQQIRNPQSIAHEAVKTFKLGLIKSMMD